MHQSSTRGWIMAVAILTVSIPTVSAAEGLYVYEGTWQIPPQPKCTRFVDFDANQLCNRIGSSWRLGYQVTPHWGVEAYYLDLGKVVTPGRVQGLPSQVHVEASAFGVAATGTLPVTEQLSAYSKVGSFRWGLPSGGDGNDLLGGAEDGTTEFSFGVGARFTLNNRLVIRFEWERLGDLGLANRAEQTRKELFSAKANFSF